MKNSARVLKVWPSMIFTSFDEVMIMSCPCWEWTNRVGFEVFNWLEILVLLLLLLTNNNSNN
jgi:hypothetical protein